MVTNKALSPLKWNNFDEFAFHSTNFWSLLLFSLFIFQNWSSIRTNGKPPRWYRFSIRAIISPSKLRQTWRSQVIYKVFSLFFSFLFIFSHLNMWFLHSWRMRFSFHFQWISLNFYTENFMLESYVMPFRTKTIRIMPKVKAFFLLFSPQAVKMSLLVDVCDTVIYSLFGSFSLLLRCLIWEKKGDARKISITVWT